MNIFLPYYHILIKFSLKLKKAQFRSPETGFNPVLFSFPSCPFLPTFSQLFKGQQPCIASQTHQQTEALMHIGSKSGEGCCCSFAVKARTNNCMGSLINDVLIILTRYSHYFELSCATIKKSFNHLFPYIIGDPSFGKA